MATYKNLNARQQQVLDTLVRLGTCDCHTVSAEVGYDSNPHMRGLRDRGLVRKVDREGINNTFRYTATVDAAKKKTKKKKE